MKGFSVVLTLCLAFSFAVATGQQDLRLEVELSETTIPICAPVLVRFSVSNHGPVAVTIHESLFLQRGTLSAFVQDPGSSDWISYHGWGVSRDVDQPPYDLHPGEEVVEWGIILSDTRWVPIPRGGSQAVHDWVFREPGTYLIRAAFHDKKAGISLTSDAKILAVVHPGASEVFPLEKYWKGVKQTYFLQSHWPMAEEKWPDAIEPLRKLIDEFPESVYARYAREAFERSDKKNARQADRRAWWPESGLEQPKKRKP